ncbi:MAG: tRNA preQ1(34) S-adenosylmethionine ribosyltransferase-isomerase QueA [Chloroflexota bacterium]
MNLDAPAPLSTADFDYELPPERIAQVPAEPRDSSRLLLLPRNGEPIQHLHFRNILSHLHDGDLLVANRSRVLPARITARRPGGGIAEILLLQQIGPARWEVLVRPGRRIFPGMDLTVDESLTLAVIDRTSEGGRIVEIRGDALDLDAALLARGAMPLPPYIESWKGEPGRYQTIYADQPGSVAAPTAGLHFTPSLLTELQQAGVGWEVITLHVGIGTFRPVKLDDVHAHAMHRELVDVPAGVLERISESKRRGGRVIAVGTTSVRALESAAVAGGDSGWQGWTELFITPGYDFRLIDGLITNFHLPRSTLIMLVSALVGRDRLLAAYQEAIALHYRFYSFGDAMLII